MATRIARSNISADRREAIMRRVGLAAMGLFAAFMLFDGVIKLLELPVVLEANAMLGWPAALVRPIGVLELGLLTLYLVRRTSIIGAVLLTGLFGATVAAHLRIGSPLFSHAFFGIYLAAIAWAGLWLRNAPLRGLFPLVRGV